jgi:hypothetical protein
MKLANEAPAASIPGIEHPIEHSQFIRHDSGRFSPGSPKTGTDFAQRIPNAILIALNQSACGPENTVHFASAPGMSVRGLARASGSCLGTN